MAEVIRRVRPTPTDEYLGNPHKGCCTFQHFNGDELFPGLGWSEEGPTEFPPRKAPGVIDGYLPTTVSYCRWFWPLLEPEEGQIDFSVIDKALKTAGERGQTLAVRLMSFGSQRQPAVPEWYSRKYPMIETMRHGQPFAAPDHNAPAYLEKWGGLVREFARRYDSHPSLESIDVTYLGPWGEGDGDCSRERCREFAGLWREAFPRTPRLALIAGQQMAEGIEAGSGWRCDCFGDVSMVGSPDVPRQGSWNHHYDCYPQQVYAAGASDAWQTTPVFFETCWVPMYWFQHGFDLDFIIEQGLKFHGSYFMPKYTRLPEAWMDRLSAFCRKLGYRFVIRQALYSVKAPVRGPFRFSCWIENVGVAPIYRPYQLALRLRQGSSSAIIPVSDVDIRTWLPGDFCMDREFAVPAGLQRGWAELSIGIVDPGTHQAKVSFAVRERFSDRWSPLGGIELE